MYRNYKKKRQCCESQNATEPCKIEKSFKKTGSENVAFLADQLITAIDDDATTKGFTHASEITDNDDF